jgi:hypothetical protein
MGNEKINPVPKYSPLDHEPRVGETLLHWPTDSEIKITKGEFNGHKDIKIVRFDDGKEDLMIMVFPDGFNSHCMQINW